MVVSYEYDGLSFYGGDADKLEIMIKFIEEKSLELLGFELIIVEKDNTLMLQDLLQEHRWKTLSRELEAVTNEMSGIRNKHFRKDNLNKNATDWDYYHELKRRKIGIEAEIVNLGT